MARKVIITAAVTGGSVTALREHPAIPKTPAEIVTAALESVEAGAAIVHVHVREPGSGLPSHRLELYREVRDRFRASGTEAVLNVTCSMLGTVTLSSQKDGNRGERTSVLVTPRNRVAHVLELTPEIGTLDCGTFPIGDDIFVGRLSDLTEMASLMRAGGVKPECECFEASHISTVKRLISDGILADPPWIQICLGLYGAPAEIGILRAFHALLPPSCAWAGFGVGLKRAEIMREVLQLGGHLRVGLEDNLCLLDGRHATNAGLVGEAVDIVNQSGNEAASARDARAILGLHLA